MKKFFLPAFAVISSVFLLFLFPYKAQAVWIIQDGRCVDNNQNSANQQFWTTQDECQEAISNTGSTSDTGNEPNPTYSINNLNVYDDPSLLSEMYEDPNTRIDGNTRLVWVKISGLDANKEYYFCRVENLKTCIFNSNTHRFETDGQGSITFKVCGADKEDLKGAKVSNYGDTGNEGKFGSDCNTRKDYFHEGHIYKIGVFDAYGENDIVKQLDKLPMMEAGAGNIITAQFFVAHSYPLVRINSTSPFTHPIAITMWGRRPGDGNNNNYQVVVEGVDNRYKKEHCYKLPGNTDTSVLNNLTVGVNTQFVSTDGTTPNQPQHVLDGTGWNVERRPDDKGQTRLYGRSGDKDNGPLGRGTYIVKVNERVSDNRPLNFAETCEGGHTFLHAFFRISDPVKDADGRTTGGGIEILKVEYDPNNSDGKRIDDSANIPPAPCAAGEMDPVSKRCKAFNVALLGKVPLEPISFIQTVYTFTLSIAGLIALAIIIRSGYKIMNSKGEKEALTEARSQLTAAVVGLIFIVFAFVILSIITVDILKIPGFG